MEAIFSVCRAGGPQLKRNPLGGLTTLITDPANTTMPITRINQFQAPVEGGPALRDFLRSIISRILDAPGCVACELLQHHDDPTRFAIIEVWDSIDAHQASASRIPPELLQQAQTLFATPAQGTYYDPVPKEAA